jgi:protein-tyrosine-phosphatase
MRVLFVCTGNICRSPMAEQLLRHRAAEAGWGDLETYSAGTWATDGSPATEEAREVLLGAGVEGGGESHRSQTLTREMVEDSDVVVAMTSVHLREIESVAPGSKKKVFLMKEIAELGDPGRGVDELLAAGRPEWRRALDLDDPMGFGIGTYRSCFRDITTGVEGLVSWLGPGSVEPG